MTPGRAQAIGLLGAALIVLGGCKPAAEPQPGGGGRPGPAVPVRAAVAVRESFPLTATAIGWVEAYATVTIRPQVSGQLQDVHFAEGQELEAGQLLFAIDPRPFETALRLAEANLKRDQAIANDAQREAERIQTLFAAGQASDQERDESRFNADAKLAQVKADEAEVERARLELDYCTIKSPIAGRAGSYLVNRGNVVEANKTELVTINQLAPIYVTFSMPERYLGEIRAALAAGIVSVSADVNDDWEQDEQGTLVFVDNQVDKSTGMLRLKASFANESRRLWPGAFVRVTLTTRTLSDVVVVPAAAVQTGQDGFFVYTIDGDQTAALRKVTPGPTIGGRTAILAGLEGGERVITDGQLRLAPGTRVDMLDEPATELTAAANSEGPRR